MSAEEEAKMLEAEPANLEGKEHLVKAGRRVAMVEFRIETGYPVCDCSDVVENYKVSRSSYNNRQPLIALSTAEIELMEGVEGAVMTYTTKCLSEELLGIQTGSDGGGRGEVGDRTPEERGPPRYGLAFLVAEAAAPSVGESEALARKQRLVLDKACRFLLD
eukprot:s250_g35.t3